MKKFLTVALGGLLAASLSSCGDDDPKEQAGPTIEDAVDACPPRDGLAEVETDGPDSVTVRAKQSDDSMEILEGQGAVVQTAECLVKELDGPASINERMSNLFGGASGASDSETWDGFEANWSYDGGSGLFFAIDAK